MNRMSHRLFCAGLAIAIVLQLVPSGLARAQQSAALSDDQVKERLGYIENALRSAQPRAETWYSGWLGAYYIGSLAGGMLAGSHWADTKIEGVETVPDREFAEGMLVTGATFVLGVGSLLLDPFTPATAPKDLGRLPGDTAEERQAKLKKAEELLRKCAEREVSGRSLTTHLLNIGANAAGAVVTKAAFKQSWGSAFVSFASGEAISLLNIFTQPMQATRDLKAYEAKYLGKNGESMPAPPERKWTLAVGPGVVSFRYEF